MLIFRGCSHGTSNPDISTDTAVLLFFSWWAGHSIGHLCLICQDLCLEELAWKLIIFGDIHGNPYLGRFKVKMLVFVLNVPHAYQVQSITNLGHSSKCAHMFHLIVPICNVHIQLLNIYGLKWEHKTLSQGENRSKFFGDTKPFSAMMNPPHWPQRLIINHQEWIVNHRIL